VLVLVPQNAVLKAATSSIGDQEAAGDLSRPTRWYEGGLGGQLIECLVGGGGRLIGEEPGKRGRGVEGEGHYQRRP
jgi:hypothetical protein